jgi:hypothetical protein
MQSHLEEQSFRPNTDHITVGPCQFHLAGSRLAGSAYPLRLQSAASASYTDSNAAVRRRHRT